MTAEYLSEKPEFATIIEKRKVDLVKAFREAFQSKKDPIVCNLMADIGYQALWHLAANPGPIFPGDLSKAVTGKKNRYKTILALLNAVKPILAEEGLAVKIISVANNRVKYQLQEIEATLDIKETVDENIFPLSLNQIHFYRRFAGTHGDNANTVAPTLIVPPGEVYDRLAQTLNLKQQHQLIVDDRGTVRFKDSATSNNPEVLCLIVFNDHIAPTTERLFNFMTSADDNYEASLSLSLTEYKPKTLVTLIRAGIETELVDPKTTDQLLKFLTQEQLDELVALLPAPLIKILKPHSPLIIQTMIRKEIFSKGT